MTWVFLAQILYRKITHIFSPEFFSHELKFKRNWEKYWNIIRPEFFSHRIYLRKPRTFFSHEFFSHDLSFPKDLEYLDNICKFLIWNISIWVDLSFSRTEFMHGNHAHFSDLSFSRTELYREITHIFLTWVFLAWTEFPGKENFLAIFSFWIENMNYFDLSFSRTEFI